MKTDFINSLTRLVSRSGLKLKKHSPEILVIAGVTGVVASTILACKASTKVHDILEDTKSQVEDVHNVLEDENISEEQYTQEDGKKDLAIIYTQTAVKFVKLYGPAVLLGAVSITCILASNNILRKRNVALAAACATIDTNFKKYRDRLVGRFGKDLDRELRYNIKAKEVDKVTIDRETGEETVSKETIEVADDENGMESVSEYAKFYDDGCFGWTKDPETNLMVLRRQQDYANEKLQKYGYLFLNDVYKMLGIMPTKIGQVVGWWYDEDHRSTIDFGIYNLHRERTRAFVNGYERTILLDFNVDGDIMDML